MARPFLTGAIGIWQVFAVQQQRDLQAAHRQNSCSAPGQLIFAHVMKTGGISVDQYLGCKGVVEGFAVIRDDGPPEARVPFGSAECRPSVCTTQSPLIDAPKSCGEEFAGARSFTVLREPVDRVWSFYNYIKGNGYLPFQARSLKSILQKYWSEDLNEGLAAAEVCTFCHHSLSNAMTLWNFVGPTTWAKLQACREGKTLADGDLCHVRHHVIYEALMEAKATLMKLDAIFFMEDVESFAELYQSIPIFSLGGQRALSSFNRTHPTQAISCTVKRENPTESTEILDAETVDLIMELNWADLELYNFAKGLPNRATLVT